MSNPIESQAIDILKHAYGSNAEFRDGQLDAIVSVVEKRKTLVVQKTGWGKSVVYFIATKILREAGAGPTIIISPLLALMKNQIDSAAALGIKAVTINSMNKSEWEELYSKLADYDAIIISPERLSNEKFMDYFSEIHNIQLFVVDEAHCISDWGHDFRPNYQRIVNLLDNFPPDIAVLGTTATANDRVIMDIRDQLGEDLVVVRGELIRENLAIQINPIQNREERLAWLAHNLLFDERLKSEQGIIYCLTQRDTETVAAFLKQRGICAEAYHSGLDTTIEQQRLQAFDDGDIRILVATIKLGMGYDKSDIRFVIHYQMPQNLISYYQQIGRAGRDGEKAYAILLHGSEDEEILSYFIEGGQAHPELLARILELTISGAKLSELLAQININQTRLQSALNYLMVHGHLYKDRSVYRRNPLSTFNNEKERQKNVRLNEMRYAELSQLKDYLDSNDCFMKSVADELDAPDKKEKCGICTNCIGDTLFDKEVSQESIEQVKAFLKNRHGRILPRKQWADNRRIAIDLQMNEGWVLSDDYYSEVGQKVSEGKYTMDYFSDDLLLLSKEFIWDKVEENGIDGVMAVPSLRRPELVPDFAKRLAAALSLDFVDAVRKTADVVEQKTLLNKAQQEANIRNSIEIDGEDAAGKTILLVDDMVDSRWTFTVIVAELLNAGARAVYPFALVKTGSGD